jgi:hypothetical protein
MEEPYTEEVATHGGPESCVGVREGIGEALTGARVGEVSSREIIPSGRRRGSGLGRQHDRVRYASAWAVPRGPRPSACTGIFMRENREIPHRPPARDGVAGRIGEAEP